MSRTRILYICGSLGLGHVVRDLAIAGEIRKLEPGAEFHWLASPPATDILASAGETLVPESREYKSETSQAEAASRGGRLSLTEYVYRAFGGWLHNAAVFGRAARRGDYSAIVGDETYEVVVSNVLGRNVLPRGTPFTMIYDFFGMEVTTRNLLEKMGAWGLNLIWSQERRVTGRDRNAAIFIGEPEDVPDRRFGFLLPHRRRFAENHIHFVGYVLAFNPAALPGRASLRAALGYGTEPLVICTIGGTAVGRALLELCGRAHPLAARRVPGLRTVLVCGPRIDPASLDVPPGAARMGLVPGLYRHLGASDLAVVQGGGTTTLEVTALRRPFIYFPVQGQSEQEVTVAGRLARQGVGIRISLEDTSPEALAVAIAENIGREPAPAPMRIDGARRAAEIILSNARRA